jgi:hypothetical protein
VEQGLLQTGRDLDRHEVARGEEIILAALVDDPQVAVALGVLVLHEHLSATMAIGATLILASVAIVVRRESGDPAAAREEAPQPVGPVADESYARSP